MLQHQGVTRCLRESPLRAPKSKFGYITAPNYSTVRSHLATLIIIHAQWTRTTSPINYFNFFSTVRLIDALEFCRAVVLDFSGTLSVRISMYHSAMTH